MNVGSTQNDCCEYKKDIKKRLNRIEGQVKGIQRMVDEDKGCVDVLTQIAAVRAAINRVGGMILEKHSKSCLQNALQSGDNKAVEDMVDSIQKFLKFVD